MLALAERDLNGNLKHPDVFQPLPPLLKRLCWEADFDSRIVAPPDDKSATTATAAASSDPHDYLAKLRSTLLFEAAEPLLVQYRSNLALVKAANEPFAATVRERRVPTKQRRALTASAASGGPTAASTVGAPPPTSTTATLLRGTTAMTGSSKPAAPPSEEGLASSGRAVAHLRSLLSDSVGAASTFRPKLVYALLSILMAQHGALVQDQSDMFGGAQHLHCTLVADILLSAGGPLPKAYQHVLSLAQVLDEAVQEGNVTDVQLVKIQAALRDIFQPDEPSSDKPPVASSPGSPRHPPAVGAKAATAANAEAPSNSLIRQLNRIITAGLTAMKEADPQSLFLNPVTDAIAPGYSKVITKPMSISTMERKVDKNEYNSVTDWEQDVKLMYKNCIDYNRGSQGQWFRGEALRQGKVFREEIFPVARRSYQTEVAKRTVVPASEEDPAAATILKRKGGDGPTIAPLPASNKKRKKEAKEDYLPSMPAIASMLLADPVRS